MLQQLHYMKGGYIMLQSSNEILIESVELNLLVTEALVDKAKNVMAAVIKNVKEIVSKIKDFIMSKLKKDL